MADLKISVDMKDIPAAVQATQRFERQINTLAAQLARGSITTATYQKALNQLSAKYRRLGVDVNSARSAVMSYGRAAAEAAREQQALFAASQASSAGINRMGVGMQQAGYQIGDFLVQVQSGTNAMVAFGQQATQLVGILPMFNSVMGISGTRLIALSAGLGIAIPLITALGAAFMRTRQNSSSATGGFTTMEAAMKAAREETTRTADEIERLNLGLRNNTELNVRRAIEEQRLRVAQAQELVASSQLDPDGLIVAEERLRREQETLTAYEDQYKELQDVAFQLEEITLQREQELKTAQELADLQQRQRQFITNETLDLENKIRLMETTLTYGEDSVELEAERARQAREAFLLEVMRNNIYGEQLTNLMALYDEHARINEILNKPVQGPNLPTSTTTTTLPPRGGAAPGIGGFAQSLLTEMEQVELYRENALEQLENFNSLELELLGGHAEARLRIEEEYQNRLDALRQTSRQNTLSETANLFGQLANIASVGGQKTVKAVATFQAIEGTINAYGAAIKALNTPGIGLAGRFAAYASVLAAGLKGVAAIRSAGGVGGGGGGVGTVAPISSAATPEPQRVVIEGIDRDSLISGEQLSRLFDRLYEENSERGIVFSVAR